MNHVLYAGCNYPEPGDKETDLFSVITLLLIALCNRSVPNINTWSSPWIGINPVTFKYVHASPGTWNQKSCVVSLDFSYSVTRTLVHFFCFHLTASFFMATSKK